MIRIHEISRIISLTVEEKSLIEKNENEFSTIVQSVVSEYRKFEEYQVKLKKLNIRHNDDSYKLDFALNEVRKNLEEISRLIQDMKEKDKKIDEKIVKRVKELSSKYPARLAGRD